MATTLTNSFEGGTNGTTITPANSGGTSGSAFDTVVGTCTFATAAAMHGSLGLSSPLAAASTTVVEWGASFPSWTGFWVRGYISWASVPASVTRVSQVMGSATPRWGVSVDSATGKIGVRNLNTGTFAQLSTTVPATATKHRYEYSATYSGSAWTVVMRLFYGSNAEGTTPDETLSPAAMTLGAGDTLYIGAASTGTTTWAGVYHDDCVLTDVGWPGPVAGSGTSPNAGLASSSQVLPGAPAPSVALNMTIQGV